MKMKIGAQKMTRKQKRDTEKKEVLDGLKQISGSGDKETLRAFKKRATKLKNYISDSLGKEHRNSEISPLANKIYNKHKEGSIMKSIPEESPIAQVAWSLHSFHPFPQSQEDFLRRIELLNDAGEIELYNEALKFHDKIKDNVEYGLSIKTELENAEARVAGTEAYQLLKRASVSLELTEEKREAFRKYSASLKNWTGAELKGKDIFINDKKYNEGDTVGVMIGNGNRVHLMSLFVGQAKDIRTEEIKDIIMASNYTQWQDSDLVVLDFADNIPNELYSER